MSLYELRDFILSLPWVGISLFVLFWLAVFLLVRKGDDGHAILISWALRIFDVFLPNSKGAQARRAEREISYWQRKDSDK